MNIEVSQDDAAVLNAVRQVKEMTGFGKVTVEVQDGCIRLIEISATILIRRSNKGGEKQTQSQDG